MSPRPDVLSSSLSEGLITFPDRSELALLNRDGVIVSVNGAWLEFCVQNGGDITRAGVGASYLDSCDAAEDQASQAIAAIIRIALQGHLPAPATIRMPCPAPDVPRLFAVLVSSRFDDHGTCVGATVTLSQVDDVVARPREVAG